MKETRWSLLVLSILVLSMGIPLLSINMEEASSLPSRAVDEDLEIDITVSFDTALDISVDIVVQVNVMILNGTLMNADQIRNLYSIDQAMTEELIEDELWNRAENLTSNSFQGDIFEVVEGELDILTLDNTTASPGDPVIYNMELVGRTDLARFIDPGRFSFLNEGREIYFITALFLSGFTYTRTISLMAYEGETVTYNIPISMRPLGDDTLVLDINSYDGQISGPYYTMSIGGSGSIEEAYFTFTISNPTPYTVFDEVLEGDFLLDWKELDTVSITGEAFIGSIGSYRSALLTSSPPSITVPDFIPSSLIRYSHLEGILTSEDLDSIEVQMIEEVETSVMEALDNDSVSVIVEIHTGAESLELPETGTELVSIISSSEPIIADISTETDTTLDILEGYDSNDVIGLLNGGLRIYHDLEPMNDDRFALEIMLPEGLYIWGDPHVRENGTRKVYDYIPGRIKIASEKAPDIQNEILSISGKIDLSNVNSMYIMDTELDIEANLTFGFGAMTFDMDDFDFDTTLDYELEYITSDMIRLLMRMGIIDREKVEEKVEDEVRDGLEDILPDERDTLIVDLQESSLIFDGDIDNVDAEEHLLLNIAVSGTLSPMKAIENGNGNNTNAIVPYHFYPILPVRSFTKTMSLEDGKYWDMDIDISLPSGLGFKAWIGLGENDNVRELEVDSSKGYPTLHLDIKSGEADRITVELKVGGWLLVNNVGACFGCCLLSVVLIILILLVLVVRMIRRKKDEKGVDETSGEEEDNKNGKKKGKEEKDKTGKKKGTSSDKDTKMKKPDGEELSWEV